MTAFQGSRPGFPNTFNTATIMPGNDLADLPIFFSTSAAKRVFLKEPLAQYFGDTLPGGRTSELTLFLGSSCQFQPRMIHDMCMCNRLSYRRNWYGVELERLGRRVFVRNLGRCSRELVVILLYWVSVSEYERDIESQCSLIQKWESKNCYCNMK